MSEVASAYVSLLPSARGFGTKLSGEIGPDVAKSGKSSGRHFGEFFTKAGLGPLRAFGEAAVALFAFDKVKDFLKDTVSEARVAQKAGALTEQVLKSTGGAANVTAEDIEKLTEKLADKSGIDDETVRSGENLLLTFKNIRNEAGKGNDIFNQAANSMLNLAAGMAAASGGEVDLRSATTLVGKALNDPVRGLTALTRVGVTFTKGQQDQIKAMVAAGKSMDAQKLILRELKSEFGGAAASQATAAEKMSVAWGRVKVQIGTALLPALDGVESSITKRVIPAISGFVGYVTGTLSPGISDVSGKIKDFFQTGAGHTPLAAAVDAIKQHVQDTLTFVGNLKDSLSGVDLSNIDASQIGTALGQAVADGLNYLAQNVAQITGAFAKLLSSVDWVGLGIDVGKQAPALAIGFAAGLLNVDVGSLFSQVMDHWWQVLIGVITIMFAPAKFAGVLERVLARIPFAGKFLAAIVRGLQGLGDKVAGFAGDLAKEFAQGFGKINIPGSAVVARVMAGLKGIPGAVGNFFGTLGTRIGVWAIDAFGAAGRGARTGAAKMLSFVASLPGKIIGALGDVGSLLSDSGRALMRGFANGITDAASAAYDAAKGALGRVRNLFPFSPAKEGPFSGKGYTTHSGNKLMKDFGVGIGKGGLAAALATRRALAKVARETQGAKLKKQLDSITEMIGDGLSGKKDQKKIGKVKDSLGKLTDAIKKQLDKQLQAAKDKVSKIADTISSLKDTIAQTASSVAQNYLPDFTTNALFGPDGKMIKGTAVSSFKSQIAAQGSVLSQVTAAYKKLVGEGLNGDWLSSLLQSGNNNLILDLGASSKSDALSAQSMYQSVTAQANALGTAVANNTTSKSQLDTAVKQLAVAQRQEAAAQRRELALKSIDHKMDKQIAETKAIAPATIRGLNQMIAAANKGRRS